MIFILFVYMQYIKTFLGTQLENIREIWVFFSVGTGVSKPG